MNGIYTQRRLYRNRIQRLARKLQRAGAIDLIEEVLASSPTWNKRRREASRLMAVARGA